MSIIGANVSATESALGSKTAGLGDRYVDKDGKEWLYVHANGAITGAGYVVTIDESYEAAEVTTSNDAVGDLIGVANVAFADNDYGWVQVKGPCVIQVAASCGANVLLNTTATAGQIDDDLTAGAMVLSGIALTTSRGGSAGTAAGMLNYPQVASNGAATQPTLTAQTITTLTTDAIAGGDSSLGITGLAAAQGGDVVVTGGTSSTGGNAGGVSKIVGGTPGATGVGGKAQVIGAAGGATSGAGGAAEVTGGVGTAGNSAGGAATIAGGAGQGTAAGGAASLTGGASGAGATGNGAAASVSGGAAASTNGNGGSVVLTGGAKTGTGVAGMVIERSVKLVNQGAPAAKTTNATLTAAEVLTGIITVNQGGAGTSAQQLPLATDMDTAIPDSAAGDAFDFSVINISTVDAEDASVTTNTGWTLVGSMDIHAYSAAGSLNSSARFRARKTGAGAWTLYRIA